MNQPLIAVIGAGPGIGLAVAKRFEREGFRSALVCLPELLAFAKGMDESRTHLIQAELADPSALDGALMEIEDTFGFPDVMVYNASRGEQASASQLTPERLAADFQVNVGAALASARWALPAMRLRGAGTLLFTGGGLALDPKVSETSLSIGKAALRSLALCLAQELASENIHAGIVSVCGFVQPGTAFSPGRVAEEFWKLHIQPREGWEREILIRP